MIGSKLYNLGEGLFKLERENETFVSTPIKIVTVMFCLGYESRGIEDGFISITSLENKVAHYGVRGWFIF